MKSLQELQVLRDEYKAKMDVDATGRIRVVVGMATCRIAAGSTPVLDAINEETKKLGLTNVDVVRTGCIGICQYEPVIEVFVPGKEKTTYVKMDAESALRVVAEHILGGTPVSELTIGANT